MSARRGLALALVAGLAVSALSAPTAAPAAKRVFKLGSRTLKAGSAGKDVRALQRSLTALSYSTTASGVFDAPTRKNVKRLEQAQKWPVNGIVSRGDAKKILKLVARRKAAQVTNVYYLQGLTYATVTITAQRQGTAALEVIDTGTGLVTATIPVTAGGPGEQSVSWNNIGTATGAYVPDGSYQFKIGDNGTAGASITGGQIKPFLLRAYAFPAPDTHSFGGAGARFGAPRSGHTHQGQDVIGACGTRIFVAQGGTLTVKAYQAGGAGNYVVVHGISGTDTVYMHMKKPSWAVQGQVVYTGQVIGKVGATGAAAGCHLHFEHWTAPGWYQGGSPYDPLPELTYWDGYS
jgi:murein DD-endopeptidase MepM/ murein hydrolase activator NlpD